MVILTEMNRGEIYFFNNEKIINLLIKFINFIINSNIIHHEYKNFKGFYITYFYVEQELFSIRYYNYLGCSHRENGPAYIKYNKNGEISNKSYFLNDKEYYYKDYLLKIKGKYKYRGYIYDYFD